MPCELREIKLLLQSTAWVRLLLKLKVLPTALGSRFLISLLTCSHHSSPHLSPHPPHHTPTHHLPLTTSHSPLTTSHLNPHSPSTSPPTSPHSAPQPLTLVSTASWCQLTRPLPRPHYYQRGPYRRHCRRHRYHERYDWPSSLLGYPRILRDSFIFTIGWTWRIDQVSTMLILDSFATLCQVAFA